MALLFCPPAINEYFHHIISLFFHQAIVFCSHPEMLLFSHHIIEEYEL